MPMGRTERTANFDRHLPVRCCYTTTSSQSQEHALQGEGNDNDATGYIMRQQRCTPLQALQNGDKRMRHATRERKVRGRDRH